MINCCTCKIEFNPRSNNQRFCSDSCRYKDPNRVEHRKLVRSQLRKVRRDAIRQIKLDAGCQMCGYNSHPAALEFDHIEQGLKEFELSKASSYSWERVEQELEKCRVLCANCHAVHSENQRGEAYAI